MEIRVRDVRLQLGITLTALAREADMAAGSLSYKERGLFEFWPSELERVAQALTTLSGTCIYMEDLYRSTLLRPAREEAP